MFYRKEPESEEGAEKVVALKGRGFSRAIKRIKSTRL
jgi:hypothetical protein